MDDLRIPPSANNSSNPEEKNQFSGERRSWNDSNSISKGQQDTKSTNATAAQLNHSHSGEPDTTLIDEKRSTGAQQEPIIPSLPLNSSQLHQLERKKAAFKLTTLTPLAPAGSRAELISENNMLVDEVVDTHGFLQFRHSSSSQTPPGFESITKKLTQYLLQTYVTCNPNYNYQPISNPRRVLTKPSKHAGNEGHDNEDCDYILYVNDIMGSTEGHQYQIIDALGSGTFGQVVKCQNIKTKEFVALKVIKNKPAYYNQSLIEVAILDMIKNQYDVNGKHHLVRIKDSFVFRNHLCIAFEMLSVNLYELIKQNQFRGLSTNLIRVFITQILDALTVLYKAKIIHCDLKPENILLKSLESPSIKVIDLGSACHANQTVYTYIQSRFYRSPEVLLGLPYTTSIDMWSLGCIAAELFLGLPLFPGSSEYNQMSRIIEILGNPPNHMCDKGKNGGQYFVKMMVADGKFVFALKSMEQYMKDHVTTEQPSKRYFQGRTLPEIINSYPIMRRGLSNREIEIEMQNRRSFIDFLSGMLRINPLERWTPQQALQHPFIIQAPFLEPFMPLRTRGAVGAVSSSTIDTRLGMQPSQSTSYHGANTYQVAKYPNQLDPRHSQIVGTFSEFQINLNTNPPPIQLHPGSVPEPSMIHDHQRQARHSLSGAKFQSQSVGNNQQAFNLQKSKSQFSVADRTSAVMNQAMGHYNSSLGLYQQHHAEMASGENGSYAEGHPRYGDQGERLRIPSRLPSAAASVEWELFEGGASVPNSYASSRQGSFTDMHAQQLSYDGRRASQAFASPNSARHMPFQGRKMGSLSNDSFVNDGRNSDPDLRNTGIGGSGLMQRASANSSSHSLNGTSNKTHKKVKSTSSTSSSNLQNEAVTYSRRPSVPSNFYPIGQQQIRQPVYDGFQFSATQGNQLLSQLNSSMQENPTNLPYQGSEPIQMPKVVPKKD